jgi:hypothetical protein
LIFSTLITFFLASVCPMLHRRWLLTRYIRDSGTCPCDVTHKTSWSATVAHSYCASLALWVMHRKRGKNNGTHVYKRGNLMTLRGGE